MATKQFAKAYADFKAQAAIELVFLPALPTPFTRAGLTEMRAHLDPVLVRNADPCAVEKGHFSPLHVLISDPLHWNTAGVMWLHLHQLTFFTISNPVKAAEFLRYAAARHARLFPKEGPDMMAMASSLMGAGGNPLSALTGILGGVNSMEDLQNIDVEKMLSGFPGLADIAKTISASVTEIGQGGLDEAAVRAKVHDIYATLKAHPMLGALPISEDMLMDLVTRTLFPKEPEPDLMALD